MDAPQNDSEPYCLHVLLQWDREVEAFWAYVQRRHHWSCKDVCTSLFSHNCTICHLTINDFWSFTFFYLNACLALLALIFLLINWIHSLFHFILESYCSYLCISLSGKGFTRLSLFSHYKNFRHSVSTFLLY